MHKNTKVKYCIGNILETFMNKITIKRKFTGTLKLIFHEYDIKRLPKP